MAYDIGPKIGIEGEAEYRKQLQQIITSQKTLSTEMTATASAFDKGEKSVKSYRAQNEVLEKQIETQMDKMELLQRAVDEASQKYGEADEKTQKWQQILNRATAELNDMEHALEENKKAASDLVKENVEKFFQGVANIAKETASVVRDVAEALIGLATDAAAFGDDALRERGDQRIEQEQQIENADADGDDHPQIPFKLCFGPVSGHRSQLPSSGWFRRPS